MSTPPSNSPLPASGQVLIHTLRLLLRAATPADAPALHLCFSDAEVMRYWSTLPHASLADTENWLTKMTSSHPTNGITDFVIVLRESLAVIGKIGIYAPISAEDRSGEIGFMLNRAYQRKGIVSEALKAVLEHLFEEDVGVETVTADVDPRNVASCGILEKFGFKQTGFEEKTWEVGGVWVDSVFLGLTREEWRGRQTVKS